MRCFNSLACCSRFKASSFTLGSSITTVGSGALFLALALPVSLPLAGGTKVACMISPLPRFGLDGLSRFIRNSNTAKIIA